MFQRIWTQNKRFILVAGAGLAVFLILNSFLGAFVGRVEGPKGLLAEASKLEKDVRSLHKELNRNYWEEKARLESYEKHESDLASELQLPREKEVEKLDSAAPLVQFNQAIDRAWGQALEKANRASVAIPEKLGPEAFGVAKDDGPQEYELYYSYLGVVRRALMALIDAGISEIGRPELVPPEELPVVAGSEDFFCVYRGVRFKVSGAYESFLRLLKSVQEPRSFLQVRILSLGSKGGGDERSVKGELEFVGFQIAAGSTLLKDEKPRNVPRRSRRPR